DRAENPAMRKLRRLPAENGCSSSTFSISSHVSKLWPFFFITIASHNCERTSTPSEEGVGHFHHDPAFFKMILLRGLELGALLRGEKGGGALVVFFVQLLHVLIINIKIFFADDFVQVFVIIV